MFFVTPMAVLFFSSALYSIAFDTGWQRPIGCLKLQVIFRKRAITYRALLRKPTKIRHPVGLGYSVRYI